MLYFNNGSGLGKAKSGGSARFIETAKRLQQKGIEVTVVGTSGSISLFNEENFRANFIKVKSSFFLKQERNNIDRAWSYMISTIHSIIISNRLPTYNIVYSPSDYFCDVIPSIYYKIRNSKTKYISMVHHLCRSPNKRKGNYLVNVISYFSQRISYRLIAKFADQILVYDTPEGQEISNYFKLHGFDKISSVANGVEFEAISNIKKNNEYRFDACFVGGLRGSKGIYDLIPIWQLVVAKIPSAKIAIIGEGINSVTSNLTDKISDAGMSDNFELLGMRSAPELYNVMKSCTLFLSTSHEEGWGISVAEALACGLPVIAFHLPAFNYLQGYISEVEKFDHEKFSLKILELLNDTNMCEQFSRSGKKFIKKYDWDDISKYEYEIVMRTANANA